MTKKLWRVTIFEDAAQHAVALHEALFPLFGSATVDFSLSDRPDVLPSSVAMQRALEKEKTPAAVSSGGIVAELEGMPDSEFVDDDVQSTEGKASDAQVAETELRRHLTQSDIIIVDLELARSGPTAKESLSGILVLRHVQQLGRLSRCFVCSQKIGSASRHCQGELEEMIDQGLTVFAKITSGDDGIRAYSDLANRVYGFLRLEQAGYSANAVTRNALYRVALQGKDSADPVLILGETGTGKEEAARHIHELANWLQSGKMVAETRMETAPCGIFSPELARCELFGQVRGAFTGADTHELGAILRALGCELRPSKDRWKSEVDRAIETLNGIEKQFEDFKHREQVHKLGDLARQAAAAFSSIIVASKSMASSYAEGAGGKTHGRSKEFKNRLMGGSPGVFLDNSVLSDEKALSAAGLQDFEKKFLDNPMNLLIDEKAPFGTVFLDEFADLHPDVQSQLLRVIENGEVKPQGYEGTIRLTDVRKRPHVRFIAATNDERVAALVDVEAKPGEADEAKWQLRADLVYRVAKHVLQLDRLSADEIAIFRDGEWEKGILIQLEDPQAKVQWGATALKYFAGEAQKLKGNRRQARMIIARAIAHVKTRRALGIEPFQTSNTVTEEILKDALRPIQVQPNTPVGTPKATSSTIEEQEQEEFRKKVKTFVKDKKLWPDCESVDWESLKTVFGTERKEESCRIVLHSVQFLPSGLVGEHHLVKFWQLGGKARSGSISAYFSNDRVLFKKVYERIAEEHGASADLEKPATFVNVMRAVWSLCHGSKTKSATTES